MYIDDISTREDCASALFAEHHTPKNNLVLALSLAKSVNFF